MIIAYASANTDPINNPTQDPIVDLSDNATSYTITIYGDAVDSENPSASFSWQWTVLDPASGITITDPIAQNAELTFNNDWRNVRVHLVATNTATSETSETNILIAPTCSFCEVRVQSPLRGIEKPAKGSRDWHPVLSEWAQKIEDSNTGASVLALSDLSDVNTSTGSQVDILTSGNYAAENGNALHTHFGSHISMLLNELSDVNGSTGAQVDILTSGSYATDNGTALHIHEGTQVDPATATAQGTVILESAISAGTVPKVLVHERLVYTQAAESTRTDKYDLGIGAHTNLGTGLLPHVIFQAHEGIMITDIAIVLLDSGTAPEEYEFQLCKGTQSDLEAGNMVAVGSALSGHASSSGDYYPVAIEATGLTQLVATGDYFGIAITAEPDYVTDNEAKMMRVTIRALRDIN